MHLHQKYTHFTLKLGETVHIYTPTTNENTIITQKIELYTEICIKSANMTLPMKEGGHR